MMPYEHDQAGSRGEAASPRMLEVGGRSRPGRTESQSVLDSALRFLTVSPQKPARSLYPSHSLALAEVESDCGIGTKGDDCVLRPRARLLTIHGDDPAVTTLQHRDCSSSTRQDSCPLPSFNDPSFIKEQEEIFRQIKEDTAASRSREPKSRQSHPSEAGGVPTNIRVLSRQSPPQKPLNDSQKSAPVEKAALGTALSPSSGLGRKVLLRGAAHTVAAMEHGSAVRVQCFECRSVLYVPSSAQAVYCTFCQHVTPIELARNALCSSLSEGPSL